MVAPLSEAERVEKIRQKIRLLLNLAGNNPNEYEAASAAAKAAELMAEYNIGADETKDADMRTGMMVGDEFVASFEKLWDGWRELAEATAKAFYCRIVLYPSSRTDETVNVAMRWIGREANRVAGIEVMQWLVRVSQAAEATEYEARMFRSNQKALGYAGNLFGEPVGLRRPRSRDDHKHDFFRGFAQVMWDKLHQWRVETAAHNAGRALVANTDEENNEWVKANIGWLSHGKAAKPIQDRNTAARGNAVAMQTDLNRAQRVRGEREQPTARKAAGYLR